MCCCKCCCGHKGGLKGGSEGRCDCVMFWKVIMCIFAPLGIISVWWHLNWKCEVPILICVLLHLFGLFPGMIFGIWYCCAYPIGGDHPDNVSGRSGKVGQIPQDSPEDNQSGKSGKVGLSGQIPEDNPEDPAEDKQSTTQVI